MDSEINLSSQIEALLFHKSEPLSVGWLSKTLGKSVEEIRLALPTLREALAGHGIILIEANDSVSLGTHPKISGLIEKITKEELDKDIGKAGLETLAIVSYKAPVSRSSIDYIRGVNSQFILRHLLARGLVEKLPSEKDGRSYLYRPTLEALAHLGLARIEDLPNFAEVKSRLSQIESLISSETTEGADHTYKN